MSVAAHKVVDPVEVVPVQRPRVRRAPHRLGPPTRRRTAGAPRVLARRRCEPRAARLPVAALLAVAGAMFLAVVGLGALANAGPGPGAVPEETTVVRVMPGESLWDVAERVAPGSEAGAVVARIQELNGLEEPLRPGQPLTVPAG